MLPINDFLKTIKKLGYHDVVVDEENTEFLKYLYTKNIDKSSLTHTTLDKYWSLCFNQKLTKSKIHKKIKLFSIKQINFNIEFVNSLPIINTNSLTILIVDSISDEFQRYWKEFQFLVYKSEISPDRLAISDFKINTEWTYQTLLNTLPGLDEGNKKRYRQKQCYYLFFLFLTSKQKALLPSQYIMSEDTFYNYRSGIKTLIFFNKNHFFTKMPFNKNLIEKELEVDSKPKYINYMRFSYMISYDSTLLKSLTNLELALIMNNLRNSSRSSKMVSVYENTIRRCLFWHGAINLSQTKKEADTISQSPLEILSDIKKVDKRYIEIFYPYFSMKQNNDEQRKNAKYIKSLIIFLDHILNELSAKNLKNFFKTTIKKDSEEGEPKLNSPFLNYLYKNIPAISQQQEIQMIVFQSVANYNEFSNCFLKNNIESIYRAAKNRKISRLALDKSILTKMKEICIFNPIVDKYYISTYIDKKKYSWKHFDKSEPQLPVMLFLYLSMPWRKEHIISMDRDNFLKKDEKGRLIEVHVTTDKNQNNDFFIEKEFFEYAISFKDLDGIIHCPMQLISETIEYVKESFPLLQSSYRKENKTWGKIKPILCKNTAHGFSPDYVFIGYYYKVFLQALLELNYPNDKISHFIQLSKKGKQIIGDYSNIYNSLETITLSHSDKFFNSTYFSPHSIRKTNITYLVNDKKSLEFVIKLSGHKALSTVLKIYIDYDMLSRLSISENSIHTINNNFRQISRMEVREIINNYQKFHSLSISNLKKELSNQNLFPSPLILNNSKKLQSNNSKDLEIFEPIYWEELATGICTNALNCETGRIGACSICPFFLTGSNFIDTINSKIMQLSSKSIEFFNIILKHLEDENLSGKEAVVYEDELQLTLAQLEGYSAIVNNINKSLYQEIESSLPSLEKTKLPKKQDMVIIRYDHIPHLKAQLEIYKYSKQFTDHNIEIEHSIDILYTKIMELILLDELPKELFIDSINNKETAVERFLYLLKNNSSTPIQSIGSKYLLT